MNYHCYYYSLQHPYFGHHRQVDQLRPHSDDIYTTHIIITAAECPASESVVVVTNVLTGRIQSVSTLSLLLLLVVVMVV